MRRLSALALWAVLTAACASPLLPPPAPPPEPAPAETANFALEVHEVVTTREADGLSFTWIYAGGKRLGRTQPQLQSRRQHWQGRLAAGNHPLRFERWIMAGDDTWSPAGEDRQPPERFIRVVEGMQTKVQIKYYDNGRRHEVKINRLPLGKLDDEQTN
ncbi:MAG: hypothetical protein ABIJ96_01665 [Elusimicrobiota bacterium]